MATTPIVETDSVASPSEHQQLVTIAVIVHTDKSAPQVKIPAWVPVYRHGTMQTHGVPHVTLDPTGNFVGITLQPFTALHSRGDEYNQIPVAISGLVTVAVPAELQVNTLVPKFPMRPSFLHPIFPGNQMMRYDGVDKMVAPTPFFPRKLESVANLVTTFSTIETGVRALIRRAPVARTDNDNAHMDLEFRRISKLISKIGMQANKLQGETYTLNLEIEELKKQDNSGLGPSDIGLIQAQNAALTALKSRQAQIETRLKKLNFEINILTEYKTALYNGNFTIAFELLKKLNDASIAAAVEKRSELDDAGEATVDTAKEAAAVSAKKAAADSVAAATNPEDGDDAALNPGASLMNTGYGLGDAASDDEAGVVGEKRPARPTTKKPRKKKAAKKAAEGDQ